MSSHITVNVRHIPRSGIGEYEPSTIASMIQKGDHPRLTVVLKPGNKVLVSDIIAYLDKPETSGVPFFLVANNSIIHFGLVLSSKFDPEKRSIIRTNKNWQPRHTCTVF